MFKLYCDTLCLLRGESDGQSSGYPVEMCTYFEVKQCISHYQAAKARLVGEGCTFTGWVTSGVRWENFTAISPNMTLETSKESLERADKAEVTET